MEISIGERDEAVFAVRHYVQNQRFISAMNCKNRHLFSCLLEFRDGKETGNKLINTKSINVKMIKEEKRSRFTVRGLFTKDFNGTKSSAHLLKDASRFCAKASCSILYTFIYSR